jgi:glyoxylase-like metal-dependent hydrolase (beta-lactamase superfamily II)
MRRPSSAGAAHHRPGSATRNPPDEQGGQMPPSMQIGDFQVTSFSDGYLKTSLDVLIGMDRAQAEKPVRTEAGSCSIPVNSFLIRRNTDNILIDVGAGNTMQPTLGRLPANLRAAGVDPSSITHVVLTHIHPDHANGLVDDAGNPHYPNAEIIVHEKEVDFWLGPAIAGEPDNVRRNRARATVNLAPYRDRLRKIRNGKEIPWLTPILAPGHTPGHTCWLIGSHPGAILAWGDLVHFSAIQIPHPETTVTYDLDKDLARKSREMVLDLLRTEYWAVAGAHVDAPGLGYVVRKDNGYGFAPASELGP